MALLILYHGLPFRAILKEISLKYEKTYSGLNVTPAYNNWTNIVDAPTNANLLVSIEAWCIDGNASPKNLSSSGMEAMIDGGKVQIEYNQNVNLRKITTMTIQYTKSSS